MKRFGKILAIVLAIATLGTVLCFSLVACNGDDAKLIGFDTELAEAMASELGVSVKFVEIDWDSKETMLEAKSLDLVWNGFTYSEDRDNGYIDEERDNQQIGGLDFSNFYMVNKQVAVVAKGQATNYTSLESFKNKKGCAEASSAGESVVNDTIKTTTTCAQLGKQLDCLPAVQAGTYDFAVVDLTLASQYIASSNGAYKDVLEIVNVDNVDEEYYAVACREGSNMKSVMNYALAKLFNNGKAAELAAKYELSANLYNGFQTVDTNNYTLPTDGDWAYIQNKGEIIVGYTIFAPMNYFEE